MKPDRGKVIKELNDIHAVACGLGDDECYLNSIGIKQLQTLINDATELLRVQMPRVMSLEEVRQFVYGSPYIIETNLPGDEPRLMWGLYSHQGVSGNFDFAITDGRKRLFDADYGKTWRCWTSRPTDEQREAAPWQIK